MMDIIGGFILFMLGATFGWMGKALFTDANEDLAEYEEPTRHVHRSDE